MSVRAPDIKGAHAKVDDHMPDSVMRATRTHEHDYVHERGLFYEKTKKKGRQPNIKQYKANSLNNSDQDLDTSHQGVRQQSDVFQDELSQLKEKLRKREEEIELFKANKINENNRHHTAHINRPQVDTDNLVDRNSRSMIDQQTHGDRHGNARATVSRKAQRVDEETQTEHSGPIEDYVQRKKIRSLKRQLRKERHSKELLSLISISSASSRRQTENRLTTSHDLGRTLNSALVADQGGQTLLIQRQVERMYYQRVRLLLDSHSAEISKVKSENERQVGILRNKLEKRSEKIRHLRRQCREMQNVIQATKFSVKESQSKAVAVCREALHELEKEKQVSTAYAEQTLQLKRENERLAKNLDEVCCALKEIKQKKIQDQEKYEKVLSILNASAQNAASRSTLNVSAFEVGSLGETEGITFSSKRRRPAGI